MGRALAIAIRRAAGQGLSPALGAAFLCTVAATTVRAETYTVAGHTIRFFPPPGYCLVTPDGVVGGAVFKFFKNISEDDIEPVGIYLDCGELTALVATHRSLITHMGTLVAAKSGGEVVLRARETRRDEIDRAAGRFSYLDLASINEQLKIHGQEKGVVFPELKDMRMVDRDAAAAYVAVSTGPADRSVTYVAVMAMTMTNQLPLSSIMVAPVGDPDVLNGLLASQRRYVASLIDLNETPDQQRLQSQATPGMFDDLPALLAGYGSIIVGAVCVLAALFLLFRMRR